MGFLPSQRPDGSILAPLICCLSILGAAPPTLAVPSDAAFRLRDAAQQSWRLAQAGDSAGYVRAVRQMQKYVLSVYARSELDNGWREMASAQLSAGDRQGARATASGIHTPQTRARAFVEIASRYKDRAAYAEAIKLSLACPDPNDVRDTIQSIAGNQWNAKLKADALQTLRAGARRLSRPLSDPRAEEHRHYSLKLLTETQIHDGDLAGARASSEYMADPEYLGRVAVAEYGTGNVRGAQAIFNEAISMAQHATGDWRPYYLERVTYSILDCGGIPSARSLALGIPVGPFGNTNHRESAINRVVYAMADSGDFAGAKATALRQASRWFFLLSYCRIASDQRLRGDLLAALTTLAEARQGILNFPGGLGFGQEDKVECLGDIAVVEHLWGAQVECRRSLTEAWKVAGQVPDEMPRLDEFKKVAVVQSICGETGAATASAGRLPGKWQAEAMAEIQKADENRRNREGNLSFLSLDPKQTPRP